MRRMTRRIGLFGGPAAMMSSTGMMKKPSEATSGAKPEVEAVEPQPPATPTPPAAKKGWLSRLFGSDKE